MYSFYMYLFCNLIGNVLRPWNPPFCGFNVRDQFYAPPRLEGFDNRLTGSQLVCCCCYCCPNPSVENLPTYKLLQASLISFGGLKAACHCYQCCSTVQDYQAYLQQLYTECESENAHATAAFYQREYGAHSFYDLVAQRLNINLGPIPAPQMQQPTAPVYASASASSHQSPPIVYATVVNP
jgi:hypothetical protein